MGKNEQPGPKKWQDQFEQLRQKGLKNVWSNAKRKWRTNKYVVKLLTTTRTATSQNRFLRSKKYVFKI